MTKCYILLRCVFYFEDSLPVRFVVPDCCSLECQHFEHGTHMVIAMDFGRHFEVDGYSLLDQNRDHYQKLINLFLGGVKESFTSWYRRDQCHRVAPIAGRDLITISKCKLQVTNQFLEMHRLWCILVIGITTFNRKRLSFFKKANGCLNVEHCCVVGELTINCSGNFPEDDI